MYLSMYKNWVLYIVGMAIITVSSIRAAEPAEPDIDRLATRPVYKVVFEALQNRDSELAYDIASQITTEEREELAGILMRAAQDNIANRAIWKQLGQRLFQELPQARQAVFGHEAPTPTPAPKLAPSPTPAPAIPTRNISAVARPTGNWSLMRVIEGGTYNVYSVAFSPTGELASGSEDKTVRLWNVYDGTEISRHTCGELVTQIAFSPVEPLVAVAADSLILWNPRSGRSLQKSLSCGNGTRFVATVAMSPDGKRCAFAYFDDPRVKVCEVSTGVELFHLTSNLRGYTNLQFSPNGRYLTCRCSGAAGLTTWDLETRTEKSIPYDMFNLRMYQGPLAFSPDNRILAVVSEQGNIMLLNPETEDIIHEFPRYNYCVIESLAFSPDAQLLAAGLSDHTIRLFDMSSLREIQCLSGHTSPVKSVAFSHDGRLLASGSSDETIRIWQQPAEMPASPLKKDKDASEATVRQTAQPIDPCEDFMRTISQALQKREFGQAIKLAMQVKTQYGIEYFKRLSDAITSQARQDIQNQDLWLNLARMTQSELLRTSEPVPAPAPAPLASVEPKAAVPAAPQQQQVQQPQVEIPECPICFEHDVTLVQCGSCGHRICATCKAGMLNRGNNVCPLCRATMQ